MKKLSLIGTALLAFTATAQAAPKIPAEFHGTWCSTPTDKVKGANDFPRGNTRQDFVGMACSEPEGGFEITITAQGFEAYGGEMSCKVIKVEKFLLNNVRKGVLNPWGPAYRVQFKCSVEEDPTFITKVWSWQNQKGYIVMELAK